MQFDIRRRAENDVSESHNSTAAASYADREVEASAVAVEGDAGQVSDPDIEDVSGQIAENRYAMMAVD